MGEIHYVELVFHQHESSWMNAVQRLLGTLYCSTLFRVVNQRPASAEVNNVFFGKIVSSNKIVWQLGLIAQ